MVLGFFLYGFDSDEDGSENQIYHDANPEINHGHVKFIRSLGTIPESQDKTREKRCQIKPFEYQAQPFTGVSEEIVRIEGPCENPKDQKEVALAIS